MDYVINGTPRNAKLVEQLTPRPPVNNENENILEDDHPLLKKFQETLKAHLLRVQKQLTEEIAELDFTIKTRNEEREEIGADLYDLQQKIESQRSAMDEFANEIQEISEKRKKLDDAIDNLKRNCDEKNSSLKEAKHYHNEQIQELGNLQILETNISKWTQEMQNEVTVAKLMANKDSQNQMAVTEEKRKMDLFLYNLDTDIRNREKELNAINDQIKEENLMIETLNKSVADANADLEALQQEHKRLAQAWGEVIIAIQQRDKVLTAIKDDLNKEQQLQTNVKFSIEGIKKSSVKEMEQNEKLEMFKNQLIEENQIVDRHLIKKNLQYNKLLDDVAQKTALVEQTEADLRQSEIEGILIESQLKSIRTKIEKQAEKKLQLEEDILELLQDQITYDKSGMSRTKQLRDTQNTRRKCEIMMSTTENQLSNLLLDLERMRGTTTKFKEIVDGLTKQEDSEKIQGIKMKTELKNIMLNIKLQQRSLQISKKNLEDLIASCGGMESNKGELEIVSLEKRIAELEVNIREVQNFWLRLQGHFVTLSENRAQQTNDIFLARKQILVIDQKNHKIEQEIMQLEKEGKDIVRQITCLNTRMDILSSQLFTKQSTHQQEEEECEHNHVELMNKLKNEEMSILSLERELSSIGHQIEEAKELVLEKHREALAWETKYKMATEAKKYHEEESAMESEMGCMKAEIHRMEVRYVQLRKAQEKLIQDLDNCVHHREHIFNNASIKEKMTGTKCKAKSTIQHKLNDMKNKLKQNMTECSFTERNITIIETQHENLKDELQRKHEELLQEKGQDSLLKVEIEQGLLLKHENLENIVRKQRRAKRYKALIGGKMMPKCRPEPTVELSMQRQREVQEHLTNLVENLLGDFPDNKFVLSRILQTLKDN